MFNVDIITSNAISIKDEFIDSYGLEKRTRIRTRPQALLERIQSGLVDIYKRDVLVNIHPDKYMKEFDKVVNKISDIYKSIEDADEDYKHLYCCIKDNVVETFVEENQWKDSQLEYERFLYHGKRLKELEISKMLDMVKVIRNELSALEAFYAEVAKSPLKVKDGEAMNEFKIQNHRVKNIAKTLNDINENFSNTTDINRGW